MDYTKIDIAAVESAMNQWRVAITNFDGNEFEIKSDSFFQTLLDAGLDSGFIDSYFNNNESLKSALTSSETLILSTLRNMEELDQSVRDEISTLLDGKPKRKTSGNNSGGGGGTYENTPPTVEQLIDNSKEQLKLYENMSMSDLHNVALEISKIASNDTTTLDKILSGEDYVLKIKNTLLASPNVSDELKKLIEVGDPKITQTLLANIFCGNVPEVIGLNDNTQNVIQIYLNNVAQNNNITLEQLLLNENYNNVLKDSLSNFKNLPNYFSSLNDENMSSSLLDVYDGNVSDGIGAGETSIIRSFIEISAQSNSSDAESIISNVNAMKGNISSFGKTSVFMNNLSNFSPSTMGNILGSLMKLKQ